MNSNKRIDNFEEIDHIQMEDNKLAEFNSIKYVYEMFLGFGYTKERARQESGMNLFISLNKTIKENQ